MSPDERLTRVMKLSEKQKAVVKALRQGAKLYFSNTRSGYYLYEENASGDYRVHRATIDNLIVKSRLLTVSKNEDSLILTPLGKTISI